MKIQALLDVPPGDRCEYPPKDGSARGYTCTWILRHTGAHKRWCRVFGDVDVTNGYKCEACRKATAEART